MHSFDQIASGLDITIPESIQKDCFTEYSSCALLQSDTQRNSIIISICADVLCEEFNITDISEQSKKLTLDTSLLSETMELWVGRDVEKLRAYILYCMQQDCFTYEAILDTYEETIHSYLQQNYFACDQVVTFREKKFVPDSLLKHTIRNTGTTFSDLCSQIPKRITKILKLNTRENIVHLLDEECIGYLEHSGHTPEQQADILGLSVATLYRRSGRTPDSSKYNTSTILPLDLAQLEEEFTKKITSGDPKNLGSLRYIFLQALCETVIQSENGNRQKAAERLGIGIATLYRRVQVAYDFENVAHAVEQDENFHEYIRDIESEIDGKISLQDMTDYARAYFFLLTNNIPKNENPCSVIEETKMPRNILLLLDLIVNSIHAHTEPDKEYSIGDFKKAFQETLLKTLHRHRDLDAKQLAKIFWLREVFVNKKIK